MPPPSPARVALPPSLARRPSRRQSLYDLVRQLARFTAIGAVMTLAYLALYAVLREALGAQGANVVAWVATAMVDTAANRRLTFNLTGRRGAARAQVEGLLVFGTGLAITSGSLLALALTVPDAGSVLEYTVVVTSNIVAGLLRFFLLRHWVFAPRRQPDLAEVSAPG
jgi:putative flippase GtrA